jgi:Flp pilus assembly protein TadD
MTPADAAAISSLKIQVRTKESENSINFADSLARYYLKYGFLDSTSNITSQYLLRDSSLQTQKKAAVLMYSIFERSRSDAEASGYAVNARNILQEIVKKEPDNLSAKSKLAMTLVTTENPMAGIMMLREVIETEPDHREALINLGLLSIQSGQFDIGAQRFERLVSLNEFDSEAMLYLGVCLRETGNEERAKELFLKIGEAENADPALKVAAEEYYKELSN